MVDQYSLGLTKTYFMGISPNKLRFDSVGLFDSKSDLDGNWATNQGRGGKGGLKLQWMY